MANQENQDREVVIKLKAWQVPYLLGSARLGIWAEDWCASLTQTNINCYDTHSGKWILKVGYIIQQIKEQAGIQQEDKEYAEEQMTLELIDKWVEEECKRNCKAWEEAEKIEYEAYQAKEKTPEEIEAEEKPKKQVVSIPITDQMMKEVGKWVGKVEAEKR